MNQDINGPIEAKSQKPPVAIEAEKSVIGCLLLEKDSIIKIADLLQPEDFYHDHHRFIYEVAMELFHRSEPIDSVTVATALQSRGKLDTIGGPNYLIECQNEVPLATHIFQYAQIVKHRSTLRNIITTGREIQSLGFDEESSIEELLEKAEKRLFSISQTFVKDKFMPIHDILNTSYEKFCAINENPELAVENRIPTGFTDLNEKLNGGFNPSDLVILAARPSMGKTAVAIFMAQSAAILKGKKIGVISLEMSKEQLVERMLCTELKIESWKLHKGKLDERDFEKIGPAMDRLGSAPIFIDDSMGSSIVELRAKARRLQMEHGLDMLLIDYLQLMSGRNPMNRVQEISEISRSLKEIARELHIPVVALSQLSRTVETRPDKRPILSDLRDSGSIEQDADIVLMLYRDDYYNDESEVENQLEINVIKHRNGGLGRINVMFNRSKMEMGDLPKEDQMVGFS